MSWLNWPEAPSFETSFLIRKIYVILFVCVIHEFMHEFRKFYVVKASC